MVLVCFLCSLLTAVSFLAQDIKKSFISILVTLASRLVPNTTADYISPNFRICNFGNCVI